ncbi:MAG TPA: hypothetical protein VFP33_06930 [Gallionella sp.]|nr:hypothetical protein [Gallionella sp.]
MTAFTIPIPRYQCIRKVSALKIKAVIENPRGYELHFEDERFCPIEFVCHGAAFYPEPGRYLVIEDGAPTTCVDATAFEAGYTLIDDGVGLPTFAEAALAVDSDSATPLQQFIYENEPAGEEAEKQFRDGLRAIMSLREGA